MKWEKFFNLFGDRNLRYNKKSSSSEDINVEDLYKAFEARFLDKLKEDPVIIKNLVKSVRNSGLKRKILRDALK